MRLIIIGGKLITLLAWASMIFNLMSPFAGNIGLLLNLLLFITLFMHGVQLIIFHSLFRTLMKTTKRHYLAVLVFGVFSLLAYRQQRLSTQA